ncbi:MAG: hypothetical protein LBI91_03440 [Spirochaetaceae bacterium]|jgi:hypothetical protein|nr:hypothetical protein [Spirochaetaceae bacterium]
MPVQIHEPERATNFDNVWAALMELRESQKETGRLLRESREEAGRLLRESREEADRRMRETDLKMQETDRRMRESREEADRRMQEADRRMRESREETDRLLRESREEADRRMRETDLKMRETDRRMRETDSKISRLGSRIGDLIEHLTASNILEQFKNQGYEFTRVSRNNKLKDANNRTLAEIDILLENGEFAMVVEVKSLLTLADVKDHMKRMRTLRQYADAHNDARKYVSSVSGALIEDEARDFALETGIYVIEHTGDTVQIRAPDRVRTW